MDISTLEKANEITRCLYFLDDRIRSFDLFKKVIEENKGQLFYNHVDIDGIDQLIY